MFESTPPFKVKIIQNDNVFWFLLNLEEPLPIFNPQILNILSRKNIQVFDKEPVDIPCLGQIEVDFTKNEISGLLLALSPTFIFLDNISEFSKEQLREFFHYGMISEFIFWNEDYYEKYSLDWDSMDKDEDFILFLENSLSSSFKNSEKLVQDSNNQFNMIPSHWKQENLYAGLEASVEPLKNYLNSLDNPQKDVLYDWFLKTKPIIENNWSNITSTIETVQNIFNEEIVEKKLRSHLISQKSTPSPRF